jgi:competence protein ComEC
MKRPLLAIVSFYVIGLLLAEIFQPPPIALFVAAIFVLVCAFILGKLRPLLIWLLLILVGWTNLTIHTAVLSPNDLRVQLGNQPAIATVRGVLISTPRLKIVQYDNRQAEHSLAQVKVTALRHDENWRPATGTIIVTTPTPLAGNYFGGQAVEVAGVIAPPPLPVAEGLFNYRTYLQRRGIYYELKTNSTNDWNVLSPVRARPLSDRFIAWAKKMMTLGLPNDEATRLLPAMTLGQKAALTDEVRQPFRQSGTMHIFAISGLHIALIAGILLGLLRVLQLPRAACGLIVLPLIWFYTAATGWQPSAIRSTIMMSVIIGGWSLKRPSDLLNSLSAAAFIILLWNPRQLFQASFQLSFLVVSSIALVLPPLNKILDRFFQNDPLLPRQLVPRRRRWLNPPLRFVAACAATSFAAWLGSLPLTAFYFHLFSPVTLLANIIVVPLAGVTLMASLGGLICGAWCPWLAELFNNSAWLFMHLMMATSGDTTKIPGAFFYVPAPAWWSVVLYFVVLIGTLTGWLFAPQRKRWSIVGLLIIFAGLGGHWLFTRKETKITTLPLKGGHAVFVDAAGRNHDWLVDCGSKDSMTFTLEPFLQGQGVNQIQHLILTEGRARNVGGTELLDQLFGIDKIYTSTVRFRSSVYRQVVSTFNQPPSRHETVKRGEQLGCWRMIYTGATSHFSHADDEALVMRGNFYGTKILLLSDLSLVGQTALLERSTNLNADIVITGLPDESEPLCNPLLAAINPKIVVVADSKFPAYRRAPRRLQARLARKNVPVIYTRKSGAVTIVARADGWNLRTMDGQTFSSDSFQ